MATELMQPPYLVVPWHPALVGEEAELAMVKIWYQMHVEGLYGIVFHENPAMTLAQFIGFFSRPDVMALVCMDASDSTQPPKPAGLIWLCEITEMGGHRRATGSFMYFKAYQTPEWTGAFGKIGLDYFFDEMKLDVLIGMTPALNRAARRYSQRMGLNYVASLPKYTCYQGVPCDALIAIMTREEYKMRAKPEEALRGEGNS